MPDFDLPALMLRHLSSVFGEKDDVRRLTAIKAIYAEDCACFDYKSEVIGHAALNAKISALHEKFPDYNFAPSSDVSAHHDVARLHWRFGPRLDSAAITGLDFACFERGKIRRLYVFLDRIPS